MNTLQNLRILLVDDMPAIHEDFRKIFAGAAETDGLAEDEALLFGDAQRTPDLNFELDSAYQGDEAVNMVQAALSAKRPYAMAFVDMRMPPGWDGTDTIEHLWRQDPRLQIVICTAYSDSSWTEVLSRLDARDRLLILKKPFEAIEVYRLATALLAKWEMTRQAEFKMSQLEDSVQERTVELRLTNDQLKTTNLKLADISNQLLQSEKMASIGVLAAGVAHEINNPISFVSSNLKILATYAEQMLNLLTLYGLSEDALAKLEPELLHTIRETKQREDFSFLEQDIRSLIVESTDGLARVRKIVQDLKDFSHVGTADWQLADLHRGLESTLAIVWHELKYKAEVVRQYGELPEVECLPLELNQVFMNLLVNAAHAIDAHGEIRLSSGIAGDQVWVEIADTGSGIAPEHLDRIFDPFFTTKPVGQGTGLGLSVSYSIIQKHHGRLDVKSVVGQGTSFRIQIPIKRAELDLTP